MLTRTLTTLLYLPIFCILALSGCDNNSKNQDTKFEAHLQQSQSYFEQGQFKAAIIEAKNALQNNPKAVSAHILLAKVYNSLGSSRQAIKQLQYIALDNSDEHWLTLAEAYILRKKFDSAKNLLLEHHTLQNTAPLHYYSLLAKAYTGLKRKQKAQINYRKMLDRFPDNIEALLALAAIDIQNGQADAAKEKIARLEQSHPNNPKLFVFKAQRALSNNDLSKAEQLLTQAITLLPATDLMTPERASVLRALSLILTRQGRSSEALIYTKLLAKAFPRARDLQAQFERAIHLYKDGKLGPATKELEAILTEVPNNDQAAQLLGIIYYLQGNYDRASKYLNDKLDPEITNISTKRAYALNNLRLNKPEKVLEFLGEGIEFSTHVETLSLYGLAALSVGKISAGKNALTKALKLDPSKARLHLALARHYNSQTPAQPTQALSEIKQAYANQPQDPWIQGALLQQLTAMNLPRETQRIISELRTKFGEQSTTQKTLGDYYSSIGAFAKADKNYNAAINLSPNNARVLYNATRNAAMLKNWTIAEGYLDKAINAFPSKTQPYKDLLSLYQQQGKLEEGLTKLISLEKTSAPDVYAPAAVLSEYYARINDIENAEGYVVKALEKTQQGKELNKLISLVYFAAGVKAQTGKHYQKARESVFKGLSQVPNDLSLLNLLAQIEFSAGEYIQAQKVIDQIRVYHPQSQVATLLTGDLEKLQGQHAKALLIYQQSWKDIPSDTSAREIYSLLGELQRHQEASHFLQQWQQQLPNSAAAFMIKATQLQQSGKKAAAISQYEKILSKHPQHPQAMNNLAWLYHQTGDSRALKLAQTAYQQAPLSGSIADTYGWILFNSGRLAEAIPMLEKAAALEPDNQEIIKHLNTSRLANP